MPNDNTIKSTGFRTDGSMVYYHGTYSNSNVKDDVLDMINMIISNNLRPIIGEMTITQQKVWYFCSLYSYLIA